MPTFRTVLSEEKVKLAKRVQVGEICGVWYHNQGAARIINFDVWNGRERCLLVYNTQELTWRVGVMVIE